MEEERMSSSSSSSTLFSLFFSLGDDILPHHRQLIKELNRSFDYNFFNSKINFLYEEMRLHYDKVKLSKNIARRKFNSLVNCLSKQQIYSARDYYGSLYNISNTLKVTLENTRSCKKSAKIIFEMVFCENGKQQYFGSFKQTCKSFIKNKKEKCCALHKKIKSIESAVGKYQEDAFEKITVSITEYIDELQLIKDDIDLNFF